MESMLSCLLCLCAISIPVIQGGSAGHFQLRMPDGHAPEQIDITADMTIRELREYIAGRIGKKKNIKTIVMRYDGQLLSDGDGSALLADAGVAVESVVEATVEDYQQMLLAAYQIPLHAHYRRIFHEAIERYPEEEQKKIDLLARQLIQDGGSSIEFLSKEVYVSAFLLKKDCGLITHFFDEFHDITSASFPIFNRLNIGYGWTYYMSLARENNGYAWTFYMLFAHRDRTGITLKLVQQIFGAFAGHERDINGEIDGRTPLDFVLNAVRTSFAHGDEGRQEIVRFLRSNGAADCRSALQTFVSSERRRQTGFERKRHIFKNIRGVKSDDWVMSANTDLTHTALADCQHRYAHTVKAMSDVDWSNFELYVSYFKYSHHGTIFLIARKKKFRRFLDFFGRGPNNESVKKITICWTWTTAAT